MQFAEKGVALIGIDSNRQDAVTEMDAFARLNGLTFPILKDVGNKVADQFGATRTPEAFLLDAQGTVRYQGRIDDQYTFGAGVGFAQPQLKRHDLAIAVDEVLAGKPVSVATTEVKGCLIGRIREPKKDAAGHLLEPNCAAAQSALRVAAIAGRDRPVRDDEVQRGRRLGRDDRRSRPRTADAALARQPRLRQILERKRALEGRKGNDLRLGRSRLPRGESRRAAPAAAIHRRLAARAEARRGRLHDRRARRHQGRRASSRIASTSPTPASKRTSG